jgi:succinoglycan biosynthesis protein ExoM
MSSPEHITVCVCTFKRTGLLARLLTELRQQETEGLFSYRVLVVDNDASESARATVAAKATGSPVPILYYVEPKQNIALARNKALQHAEGDYVAFIDDDELPPTDWLATLFKTRRTYQVDGVLGPVKPRFDEEPPAWVTKGKFYDRPTYPTGFIIDWRKGRTGNVLLRKQIFVSGEEAFRPDFLTGEDQDFFRRMIEKGHVFVWCDEAVAYEVVPPIRWKRSFMLKRALLRGKVSLVHPTTGVAEIAKSFIAVPAYTLLLPVLLVVGKHAFMQYLVKIFDHLGRILAVLGFDHRNEKYVTE